MMPLRMWARPRWSRADERDRNAWDVDPLSVPARPRSPGRETEMVVSTRLPGPVPGMASDGEIEAIEVAEGVRLVWGDTVGFRTGHHARGSGPGGATVCVPGRRYSGSCIAARPRVTDGTSAHPPQGG